MTANVLRKGERVWIDGIPSFSELGNPVCTFAGSMAAALAVTPHPLSVEDILGLSGYAFHVRWCQSDGKPTGCPGSVSLEQGFLPAAFSQHSGWQMKILFSQGWDSPEMQRAIPDIVASIDAGKPVIIEDEYVNASVLYGYVNQGEKVLVNTYMEGHIEAELADLSQDPAYAFILEQHVAPPPFADVFQDILNNAITWWHQEHEPDTCGGPHMRIGRVALENWARFYDSIDELASTYTRGKKGLLYNSLWNYQHLYENRKAAVNFLSRHAEKFPKAEKMMRKAAAIYQAEVTALASALDPDDGFWREFNQVRAVLISRTLESAPWEATRSVDRTEVWTREVQQRERAIMEEALRLEHSAIEHLKEAHARISG